MFSRALRLPIFIFILSLTRLITVVVQKLFPAAIVINRGVVFGWLTHPFVVVVLLVMGVLVLFRLLRSTKIAFNDRWGLALVAVGGLSNILDRLLYGGVIDYWPLFGWSTFNLADVEILLGVVWLVWPVANKKAV